MRLSLRCNPASVPFLRALSLLTGSVLIVMLIGCSAVPLEQQQRHIRNHQLPLGVLTTEAFLTTWGVPTYQHTALVQFYPISDGQLVPSFLVPAGEAPQNWDSTILSDVGLFFGYPEQGRVLGFVDNRLVYHGQFQSAEVHRVGKGWANELKYRTRTEAEFLQGR